MGMSFISMGMSFCWSGAGLGLGRGLNAKKLSLPGASTSPGFALLLGGSGAVTKPLPVDASASWATPSITGIHPGA